MQTLDSSVEQASAANAYMRAISDDLAAFQSLEELLKCYVTVHFSFVRDLLDKNLPFNFDGSEFRHASLGRLIGIFSKVTDNESLVIALRTSVKRRDSLAHESFSRLHVNQPKSTEEYRALVAEHQENFTNVRNLIRQVGMELAKIAKQRMNHVSGA